MSRTNLDGPKYVETIEVGLKMKLLKKDIKKNKVQFFTGKSLS